MIDPEKQTKEYRTWKAMQYRCAAHGDTYYHNKGIRVCKRWANYRNFLRDMGRAPSEHRSIDRLNSNRNYSPSNCRWATDMEQGKTRTDNSRITFRGVTMIAADWGRALGIDAGTISGRLRRGWSLERALTEPSQPHWSWQKRRKLRDINVVLREARERMNPVFLKAA
jgi:hypothetical protein